MSSQGQIEIVTRGYCEVKGKLSYAEFIEDDVLNDSNQKMFNVIFHLMDGTDVVINDADPGMVNRLQQIQRDILANSKVNFALKKIILKNTISTAEFVKRNNAKPKNPDEIPSGNITPKSANVDRPVPKVSKKVR